MSTFTPFNGSPPKSAEAAKGSTDEQRQSPTEADRPRDRDRQNGPSSTVNEPSSSPEDSSAHQRDGWSRPAERPPYHSSAYPDVTGTHKRKRSGSVEPQRDHPQPPSQHDRSPPAESAAHQESHDQYETPQRPAEYARYADESRDGGEGWYSQKGRETRPVYGHPAPDHPEDRGGYDHPATSTEGPGDEQMGDPLRRTADSEYGNMSPEDERPMPVYVGPYNPDTRRDHIIQSDPKKRKRNFSNRTKTGCLTCRKRKKKCDEQKPECSNCIRGGFLCAGYPPQRGHVWQKPDNKAVAIPLESKDPTYVPPGAYGMPQQNPYGNQPVVTQKRDTLAPYRGQSLRIEPPQGRPLLNEDNQQTASTIPSASVTSPENNKLSATSYSGNVFPTPISANTAPHGPFSERMGKDYQRVPPLHDLSRTDPETPHPGTTLPQINILHATRTNSPASPQPPTTNVQVAAQLALSHNQFPGSRPRSTQKEEMLAGRLYYPFDRELVLERERCSAACWRFNNSTNPNNGVSPTERARLFREILQPREPVQISPTLASPITNVGRVGENVVVEAPFTCDYGYNICIGENVLIGRNCTIIDTCEVRIGDNCHIGPNVNIYTASLPIDPKKRMGSNGPHLGKPVYIDADCWIGGGAILLPGCRIGKGSTVGAGTIVTKDVPPFTVVVGNPAKVLRGVSS